MSLKVKCQHCESQLTVKDELAGKRVKCPKCGQSIQIGAAAPSAKPSSGSASDAPARAKVRTESPESAEPSKPVARKPPAPLQKPPAAASSSSKSKPIPDSNDDELFPGSDDEPDDGDDDWMKDFGDQDDPNDPYSNQLPPARSSRDMAAKSSGKSASRSSTTNPDRAESGSRKPLMFGGIGTAVGLLLGLGIGFVAFRGSDGDSQSSAATSPATTSPSSPVTTTSTTTAGSTNPTEPVTASTKPPETKAPPTLPPPRPELTAEQLAEASDLRRVVAKMEEVLKAGNDEEFLTHYAPYSIIYATRMAEKSGKRVPPPTVPKEALLSAITAVAGQVAEVDPKMTTATLKAELTDDTNSEWAPAAGYDGDIDAAIDQAIADLEQDKISDFMRNMFPPDALKVMFRNGPEQSFAAKASKDSALVVRMLQDLKSLKKEKPQIDGDVAEFTLPPVEWDAVKDQQIRPAKSMYPPQDRVIRFSRIDGHWRFYDDGSLRQTSALSGKTVELQFERIGNHWRLAAYPRS